ncbi:MAG: hypothetical protein RLZZ383_1422 [Pseudomonadota bacterium]|jgi:hypothetical protein
MIRPATPEELRDLQTFDGCGAAVATCVADKLDILARWEVLGVVDQDGANRLYVAHAGGGAVAYVEGDGETFGRAATPTTEVLADAATRLRVT